MAFLDRFISLTCLFLFLCGPAPFAQANDLLLTEQKIKAGLLYNFIKNTTWPAEAEGSMPPVLTVCVYGEDIFADYLQPMAGRTVNQRKIAIQLVASIEEADSCEVVFVSAREYGNWSRLDQYLDDGPVLTISDSPGFGQNGGMIEFRKKDQRIGAVFNLDAFRQGGLEVNESLLTLSGVETLHQATEEIP